MHGAKFYKSHTNNDSRCNHNNSPFCNHIAEEEIVGCFSLIVFLLPGGCWCFVSFPRGAVGWFAVCYCGFAPSYSLDFLSAFELFLLLFSKGKCGFRREDLREQKVGEK